MTMKLTRRGMIFRIVRLVGSKLIKGEYSYPNVSEISAEQLFEKLSSAQPPLLIDVRSHTEFTTAYGHLPKARLIPLMELVGSFPSTTKFKQAVSMVEAQFAEIEAYKPHEVVTICPGGGFSLVAAEIMAEAGFERVTSLAGGADGWFKQGYPTSGPVRAEEA
jgi:rhodanese-related sulfurtransferase